ncbi:endonuclease NucS domain-containing protein [Streptomyces nigra]|uniref:endonuclease NucS domain-containing protein n=1 Tax=Streptomyces nigra TaxID=1827580 RepID=UPI0036A16175
MSHPYENQIRDELCHSLSLIEPGLRLVGTEYRVPNAHGTRGYIDILARDAHGSWVVIEIKRADGPARQALHEVTKYTELLREERGVRQDRIRAIIISTTWKELLTPVSNVARDWSHDLRGYKLILDSNGKPMQAQRVDFLPAPVAPRVTSHHFIYFYNSPEGRDHGWQEIVDRAAEVGGHNVLGADFRRVDRIDLVHAPFGLYFAIGGVDPEDLPDWVKETCEDLENSEIKDPLEYEVLCHVTGSVFAADFDNARPGVLRGLHDDPCWQIEGYRAAGAFAKRDLLDEHDLLRDLNGEDEGIGEVLYSGSARTTDRGRWPVFLEEGMRSLGGNPAWRRLVQDWLINVASQPAESDIHLHVYNPCDLIGSLLHGWPDDLERRVPMLSALAITGDGPHRSLRGQLYWDGARVPDIAERVRSVYREPLDWGIAKSTGGGWETDLELVEELRLHYILIERIGENPVKPSKNDEIAVWMLEDGMPVRLRAPFSRLHERGWEGIYPFSLFVHEHQDQLARLVTEFRDALAFQPL